MSVEEIHHDGDDKPLSNVRTRQFKALYKELPEVIQLIAQEKYKKFVENPKHPGLRHHALKENKVGQILKSSYSVSINKQYRAIYIISNRRRVWYWIGSHANYDRMTGSK
jgi:plasmid maintenance system killer protein